MKHRIKDYHIVAISDFMQLTVRTSSQDLMSFCAPSESVSVYRQSLLGFDIRYTSIIKLSFSFVFSLYLLFSLHYLFICFVITGEQLDATAVPDVVALFFISSFFFLFFFSSFISLFCFCT